MEEILASIRRIIADDQEAPKAAAPRPAPMPAPAPAPPPPIAAPAPPPPAAAPAPSAPDEEDVLELAEVAQPVKLTRPLPFDEEPPEVDFRDIEEPEPAAVEEFVARAPEPAPLPFMAPPPGPARPDPDEALLSQTSHASVGQAFNMLAHTVLTSNARTLEDLVREMLRPMLKNWLDDNLPTMVERLVRAEIERVARGGR